MPTLDKLHKEWNGKGLVVLGLDSNEDAETVRAFYGKNPLAFPTAIDPEGRVRAHYGGRGIPFTVFLDREGRVAAEISGPRPEEDLLATLRRVGLK